VWNNELFSTQRAIHPVSWSPFLSTVQQADETERVVTR